MHSHMSLLAKMENYSYTYYTNQKVQNYKEQQQKASKQKALFVGSIIFILIIIYVIFIILIKVVLHDLLYYDVLNNMNDQIDNPSINLPFYPILLAVVSYLLFIFITILKVVAFLVNLHSQFIRLAVGGILFFICNTYIQTKKLKYKRSFKLMVLNNAFSLIVTQLFLLGFLIIGWILTLGDLQYLKETVVKKIYFHFVWNTIIIFCCYKIHNQASFLFPKVEREQPNGAIIFLHKKFFQTYEQRDQYMRRHQ